MGGRLFEETARRSPARRYGYFMSNEDTAAALTETPAVVATESGFTIVAMGGAGRTMVGFRRATRVAKRLPNWGKGTDRAPKTWTTGAAAARVCAEMADNMANPFR